MADVDIEEHTSCGCSNTSEEATPGRKPRPKIIGVPGMIKREILGDTDGSNGVGRLSVMVDEDVQRLDN